MKSINREEYKKIYFAAECEEWREVMREEFANLLVFNEWVEVSEELYKKARKHASERMNNILDKIFGKDEPEFKVGDLVVLTSNRNIPPLFRSNNTQIPVGEVLKISDVLSSGIVPAWLVFEGYDELSDGISSDQARHATPSEIEAYKKENETVRVYVSVTHFACSRLDLISDEIKGYYDIKLKDLKK